MKDNLTSFQKLLIQNIKLKYGPVKEFLTTLRATPLTWQDIGAILGCGEVTLRKLRQHFNIEPTKNVIYGRKSVFPNATDLFKKFDNPEDAVIGCRDKQKLTVWETAKILGISESSVVKYTPSWLQFVYNVSEDGHRTQQETGKNSGKFRINHPWDEYENL